MAAKKRQSDTEEERPSKTALTREKPAYDPALEEGLDEPTVEVYEPAEAAAAEPPAPLTHSQRLSAIIPTIPGDVLVSMLEQHHFGFQNDKLATEERLAKLERHILGKTLGPGEES
jgi:hypothetical protein